MLRAMRENAKWIFYILAFAFVGWLVFDVGMGVTGRGQYGGADVVLKVNGRAVHVPQYQQALQAAYDQYRHQGAGRLTREDEQQISDQVVKQLVQQVLFEQEYKRLGITVSDEEVIQAARSSPPPEIMGTPEFQTNGQFDISKWQRFLASGSDPRFLEQLEARYRDQIPQLKLAQYVTADVYVSDAKLWRIYRDLHEAVTVALLAVRPDQIGDADTPVSDAELEGYYRAHAAEFKQRAMAFLSFVAVSRVPDAADSAAARARVRRLRAEAVQGPAKFEEVAKRESADSVSGAKGGDLGWIRPDASGFDPLFLKGLKGLTPGEVSAPVLSSFGYHLIRVDAARGALRAQEGDRPATGRAAGGAAQGSEGSAATGRRRRTSGGEARPVHPGPAARQAERGAPRAGRGVRAQAGRDERAARGPDGLLPVAVAGACPRRLSGVAEAARRAARGAARSGAPDAHSGVCDGDARAGQQPGAVP